MPATPAPTTSTAPVLACGNCRAPMQRLVLPGHYGREVELDLCAGCHLVWFDLTETARLTGPALLELIGAMARSQTLPHQLLRPDARCVRCAGGLKTVHNRSRWGQSLQLECLNRHGAYQSFAQFLQEKGLLRPMSRVDRAQLLQRNGQVDCVNCGASIGAADEHCSHCRSVPSLLDVARLARALDPEGAIEAHAVHATPAHQAALQCAACGAALPPGQSFACTQCGATLAVSRLGQAHERVEALGPALRAHAAKPAPAVVKRRLEALDADIPRRREWAAKMEAEAREMRGVTEPASGFEWPSLLELKTNPLRAVLLALVIWFVWWFW
jgi:hypothetical protein